MSKMRKRSKDLTPEERLARSVSAKRKFRAIVKLIIANLNWLQDLEDEKLGDNVKKNIQVLTRKKGKKSLLTLKDKAVLNKPAELRTEAEKNHLRRIIGNLKCFRRYPPEVKNELPGVMYFCSFGPNRVIVKQGAEPINMYVILTGEVLVSVTVYDNLLKETVEKTVGVMGPGSYFGEVSLLHGINRTATVTTSQTSEFLYIKRDDFDRVLKGTVANLWAEIQKDMAMFSYFKTWTEEEIRESCILAKKKYFKADQIILSSTGGQHDCVYFVTKGTCYLIEALTIKTVYNKGLPHYVLIETEELDAKTSKEVNKDIRRLHQEDSQTQKIGISAGINTTSRTTVKRSSSEPSTQVHFINVCTFNKLACFNVGETLKNRIIVASEDTECLLLPHYFLMEKSTITFKTIQHYLNHHIPSTKKVFQNFLEEKKWNQYKKALVQSILAQKKAVTNNSIHNVPYSIRLQEDLVRR